MKSMNPYLNFSGTSEEAFEFYKSVLGGEIVTLVRFKEMPGGDNIPAEAREKIMHIALRIRPDTLLMATDALESMGRRLTIGNNHYLMINPESREEADKNFSGLSAGGQVEMPMQNASWGGFFGSFTDMFGIRWMINFDPRG